MLNTRRTGAIGALLDIYEEAVAELKKCIQNICDDSLPLILDIHTQNEDCRSQQTILTHVVYAGFGYATSIYNQQGHNAIRPDKALLHTVAHYCTALDEMFAYTEKIFHSLTDDDLEQTEEASKILTGWGQRYDAEQLMEHAIVHVLRHRRQIEKMKQQLPGYQAG